MKAQTFSALCFDKEVLMNFCVSARFLLFFKTGLYKFAGLRLVKKGINVL
jgi:hypothetical protein